MFTLWNKGAKEDLINEIISKNDNMHDSLITLVKDKFGNYVVQKMIEYSDNDQKDRIIQKIISSGTLKKKDSYSKHVVTCIEKLGYNIQTGQKKQNQMNIENTNNGNDSQNNNINNNMGNNMNNNFANMNNLNNFQNNINNLGNMNINLNNQNLEGLNIFNNDLNMNQLENQLSNMEAMNQMNLNNFQDNDYQLELNDFQNNHGNNEF